MDVPKPSKTCCVSGRELQPGDVFFSALVEEKDDVKRLDVGVEHWTGPPEAGLPENWIGWWKARVPAIGEKKIKLAPNDILFNLFDRLRLEPDQADMLYVLTLLLIRRRVLRYDREEKDESGRKILVVYSFKDNSTFEIPVAMPESDRLEEVQEQLSHLLYN